MRIPFQSLISAYGRLLIFAVGLLMGIQVPAFIDQYAKRVDAHYREASVSISGFQATANQLFGGDLQALVAYYRNSPDPVFRRDAGSVQNVVDRYNRLQAEWEALNNNPVAVALHVLLAGDREFLDEAVEQYSYTVPLDWLAVQWGLSLAILLTLSIDLSLFTCRRCVGWVRRRRPNTSRAAP